MGRLSVVQKRLKLIQGVASSNAPTMSDLIEFSKSSQPSIIRMLREIKNDYGVKISFKRKGGGSHVSNGYYEVIDWGVFDKNLLNNFYGNQECN